MSYSTIGFPAENPTVYELYWSPSQVFARAHPNLLRTQAFLMSHWHSVNKSARISTSHPVAYADRLRIRQPGDVGFALGPHVDSGSCERWVCIFSETLSLEMDHSTSCETCSGSEVFSKQNWAVSLLGPLTVERNAD